MKDREKCFICNKDITNELPKIDVNDNHYCNDCYLDKCKKELKAKDIEEMVKVMPEKIKDPLDNSRYIIFGKSLRREIARIYYNAGYRKLPEDSVVLSREEYESLKGCENTVKRLSKISPTEAESENKALKEEIAIVLAQKRNIWNSYNQLKQNMEWEIDKQVKEELDRAEKRASKETAEKILNTIYDKLNTFEAVYEIDYESYVDDVLWEIAKQFGLEIKE